MNAAARIGVCAGLLLAGCVEDTLRPDYAAYLLAQQNIAAAQAEQRSMLERDLTAQANRCTTDACSIAVAGFRALALSGGGQATIQIASPPVERNAWDRAISLIGAISPLFGDLVQYKSIVEANKTQRFTSQENAQVQIAQATAWTGVLRDVAATPSFYVGGNYAGNDMVGRDKTGRDRIDVGTGLYNTGDRNRFNSPNQGGNASNCPGGAGGTGAPGGTGGSVGDMGGTGGNGAAGGAGAPGGDTGCVGGAAGG
jgi:hypothetical protein